MNTKIKLIKTGDFIEEWLYKKPLQYGHLNTSSHARTGYSKTPQEELIRISTSRAKNKLRRLIIGNIKSHKEKPVFLTLTTKENITDLRTANKEFTLFIKRLTYKLGYKPKYVAVPEFQDRGAVHYHIILLNLRYQDSNANFIRDIWRNGEERNIDIKLINRTSRAFNYIIKYVSATYTDIRFKNKKRYFWSLDSKDIKSYNEEDNIKNRPPQKYITNQYHYSIKNAKGEAINEVKKTEYLTL